VGWVSGLVIEARLDQYSNPGHILVPGLRLGSNLELFSSSSSLEPVARSLGSLQVTGLDSDHGSSPVEFPPSPVRVLGENAGSASDGSSSVEFPPSPVRVLGENVGSAGDGST
jgi:hypothetical protein